MCSISPSLSLITMRLFMRRPRFTFSFLLVLVKQRRQILSVKHRRGAYKITAYIRPRGAPRLTLTKSLEEKTPLREEGGDCLYVGGNVDENASREKLGVCCVD
mmetsp:Transcript_24529/g.41128  ORF Transcript_24529/g.41128 Transcript_24529/m.41128 type:complete len:103 (+) Transcript_24529:917-1225(+)